MGLTPSPWPPRFLAWRWGYRLTIGQSTRQVQWIPEQVGLLSPHQAVGSRRQMKCGVGYRTSELKHGDVCFGRQWPDPREGEVAEGIRVPRRELNSEMLFGFSQSQVPGGHEVLAFAAVQKDCCSRAFRLTDDPAHSPKDLSLKCHLDSTMGRWTAWLGQLRSMGKTRQRRQPAPKPWPQSQAPGQGRTGLHQRRGRTPGRT